MQLHKFIRIFNSQKNEPNRTIWNSDMYGLITIILKRDGHSLWSKKYKKTLPLLETSYLDNMNCKIEVISEIAVEQWMKPTATVAN